MLSQFAHLRVIWRTSANILPANRVEWNLIGYLCRNDRSRAATMFAERTFLFAPITARAISPARVFVIRFIGP